MTKQISDAISDHVKDERKSVAQSAYMLMQRYVMLLQNNHTLVNPYSVEQLGKWFESDVAQFKANFIDKPQN